MNLQRVIGICSFIACVPITLFATAASSTNGLVNAIFMQRSNPIPNYSSALQIAQEDRSLINALDATGITPLVAAIEALPLWQKRISSPPKSLNNLINFLIDMGANPNIGKISGLNALSHAILKRDYALAKTLIDHKADVNTILTKNKKTPLLLLADQNYMPNIYQSNDYLNLVQKLIKNTTDLEFADIPDKHTALMAAAYEGNTILIEKLLDAGAQINTENEFGETALSLAAERTLSYKAAHERLKETIILLLKNGADSSNKKFQTIANAFDIQKKQYVHPELHEIFEEFSGPKPPVNLSSLLCNLETDLSSLSLKFKTF